LTNFLDENHAMSFFSPDLTFEFDAVTNLARVRYLVSQMTEALGFDYWHYERANYKHYAQPESFVVGDLPTSWLERERLQDPSRLSLQAAKQRLHFVCLPPVDIWGVKSKTSETSGWSQLVRGSDGATLGIFSLVRRQPLLTRQEITDKAASIYWLAHRLHDKITEFDLLTLRISSVERDIMRWTADGKSTAEIAAILEMKERTVTFRISNVMTRMGVQNKTAAAVRLAVSGLLF
jgi:LuxR family transcriptional regulator, quorum-sensing system regulator SolR